MNETVAHVVDRTGWPAGPWDGEPDRVEWRSEGVSCMAIRNQSGVWCGYAAVDRTHPWYGQHYSHGCTQVPACGEAYCGHAPDALVDVHGGLTYADACSGHICHVPQVGEPDDVWWFGFDCGHGSDVMPSLLAWKHGYGFQPGATYKDVAYVRAEVEKLAAQLRAAR